MFRVLIYNRSGGHLWNCLVGLSRGGGGKDMKGLDRRVPLGTGLVDRYWRHSGKHS